MRMPAIAAVLNIDGQSEPSTGHLVAGQSGEGLGISTGFLTIFLCLAKAVETRNLGRHQMFPANRVPRMHRYPTAQRWSPSERRSGVPRLVQLSGTLTVLGVVGWLRPTTIAAQGIGTMQVTAEVVRAEPAWSGLIGAQQAAHSLAVDQASHRVIDLGLSRINVDAPEDLPLPAAAQAANLDSRPVAVVIQYLRN